MSYIIQAKNLAKSYGDFRALKGISFSINKGECFGFLVIMGQENPQPCG